MKRNWVHKRKIETIYVVWFLNSAQNLHCFPIFKRAIVRLPGGPAVNSVLTMQRTQVPSLVGEVRSHMPQSMATKPHKLIVDPSYPVLGLICLLWSSEEKTWLSPAGPCQLWFSDCLETNHSLGHQQLWILPVDLFSFLHLPKRVLFFRHVCPRQCLEKGMIRTPMQLEMWNSP